VSPPFFWESICSRTSTRKSQRAGSSRRRSRRRQTRKEGTHELSGRQTIASSVLLELVNGRKRVEEGRGRQDGDECEMRRSGKDVQKGGSGRSPSENEWVRGPGKTENLDLRKHGCARLIDQEREGKRGRTVLEGLKCRLKCAASRWRPRKPSETRLSDEDGPSRDCSSDGRLSLSSSRPSRYSFRAPTKRRSENCER
jgi:hypothetical protein